MPTPAKTLYQGIAAAIAADTTGLGIATFCSVVPILSAYTPGVTLQASDLVLGTGTLAKVDATAVPVTGLDPVTGQYKILVLPPAGGWKWTYDATTPAPPVQVFGYALIQKVGGALLGVTNLLNPPLTLSIAVLLVFDEFSFLLIIPPLQ